MTTQNKKELQDIKSLQQDLNKLLKEREGTGEKVTRGLKKEINMYNTLIEKGKEAVENGLISSKQATDQAKSILKVAKVKNNLKDIEKELTQNAKFMLRSGKLKNKTNFNNLKASRALLKGKKRRLQVEHATGVIAEKAKGALMSQVVQGGLLVTIFMGLKKLALAFAEKIDTLGKSFGVAGAQSGVLQNTLLQSSVEMTKLGVGLDEAISMSNTLSSEWGFGLVQSAGMSKHIADSAIAMGLTTEEGANLFGTLMSIGNMTQKQAEKLAESAYHLAVANDVAPQAVIKDIAANSDFFAKHMKDGGKNILDAAVQAKKLGLSLSTVDSIAGGLLDFQSSLNSEIEASIMLGRDINLQKARELALSDDLTGMMNEVVKQAGGEAEFNKLNRLEREAIAKAIGVSATDMAKLVGEHGKLESQKSFADIAGDDAMSSLTAIINQVKALGAELLNIVGPQLEATAGTFLDWMKSSEGMSKMRDLATSFVSTISNLPNIINNIISLMTTWKIISIGVALANAAIMAFKMGSATFGTGAIAGALLAATVFGMIKAITPFQHLGPGMSVTPADGSAALAHGTGTFGSETILHTNEIVEAIAEQNRIHKETSREQAKLFAREMDSLLARMNA